MKKRCELYPTLVTPFTKDNQIDYPSLSRLLNYMFREGCDGIFAVCQSSEMAFLSEEEKLSLATFCIDACRAAGRKCVVSGHTHDSLEEQIAYLQKLEKLKPDAVVLVTNRLAGEHESDDVWIQNLDTVLSALSPDTRLGLYECPRPYKRLLTDKTLEKVIQTGRFDFIKDTCCDLEMMKARLSLLKGTGLALYNADSDTLAESVLLGAAGYSGVMLNFFPEVFALLKGYLTEAEDNVILPLRFHARSAGQIADFIAMTGKYETSEYPLNAKHYLMLKGIIDNASARSVQSVITKGDEKGLLALANAVERMVAKVHVFPNRQFAFEEGKHFRNCHASTILPLKDGTVLLAYFAGYAEGHNDVGIWLSRKENGVWQEPFCVVKTCDLPHWNPVLFSMADGGIRLVYKVGPDVPSWKSWTKVSYDGGKTWSEETPYLAPNDAGGPVRSKPIYLSNGTLLAPNSDETETSWTPRVDISHDNGATFSLLARVPVNTTDPTKENFMAGVGAIQPTLWESKPGHVHMLLRTTSGFIFRSDSKDFGRTWCEAYKTGLPSNNSGIEIEKHGDVLYLVLNPIYGNWASRNPIVIKRSFDNGATFSHFVTLDHTEFDPATKTDAEFSYPSAGVYGDTLYVAYTHMRRRMAVCEISLKGE
jgi:dihydrodipicolinate synthase/N-acetylneuraminate lyase/predicted neuraminidase